LRSSGSVRIPAMVNTQIGNVNVRIGDRDWSEATLVWFQSSVFWFFRLDGPCSTSRWAL
jgi:hypothetical protein